MTSYIALFLMAGFGAIAYGFFLVALLWLLIGWWKVRVNIWKAGATLNFAFWGFCAVVAGVASYFPGSDSNLDGIAMLVIIAAGLLGSLLFKLLVTKRVAKSPPRVD